MATSVEYIQFVCEQIKGDYAVRYKKMFGEYMVYVNEKPILLVCDNTVFLKKVDSIKEIMKSSPVGFPYEGAKEHYVLDIENNLLTENVLKILTSKK